MYVKGLRASFDYQFLVLDSLDALEIIAKYQNPRKEFFDLISWIRGLGCTTFVLGEVSPVVTPSGRPGRTALAKHKEEYLVDGILHVRLARQGDFGMQRQLRVVKMRGVRHNADYHALVFDNGFKVTSLMG
jgi:KaiC/GvpD/RAD55 family RecA-like ATPase